MIKINKLSIHNAVIFEKRNITSDDTVFISKELDFVTGIFFDKNTFVTSKDYVNTIEQLEGIILTKDTINCTDVYLWDLISDIPDNVAVAYDSYTKTYTLYMRNSIKDNLQPVATKIKYLHELQNIYLYDTNLSLNLDTFKLKQVFKNNKKYDRI